ncbi:MULTISPECIES: fimbrial protein [Prevotellaceae]|uniref:DUF4906 domain-containing protein n=1 Tax=Prevotellaceae TaxID=171552 RepID=UPI001313DE0A|nr:MULTISPECIES: DUF4906 domain-containing protein [Prevotellaceae]
MKLAYLLMGVALLLSSCSEDIFPGGSESNEDVTISLAYSDVSPRDIVVNSRATDAEERHLDNLYIYIFDGNGNLKGYKGIEGEVNLNQYTSNNTKAEITGIKTRSGESYIYAVANISTGLYPVETSSGTVAANKLPINLNEETARAGGYDFTLDQLKALTFKRNNTSIDITSAFLMSGAVQDGNLVNITTAGTIASGDNAIRLSRIVSKVKFTIKAAKTTGVTRSFKLETYDIMNIAVDGSLVGKIDGNRRNKTTNVNNNIGNTVRPNDVENDAQFFEVYLPENLQDAVHNVTTQAEREDDSQSIPKEFTNAPANGTYVVLKGKYEETTSSSTKSADVTYYVHLGDCSRDKNNYDVERNCKYTYNITVAGVDKIIVEAKKESGADQPGAEGVVLEYGATGKNMTLDSHYEYMVMRFYQNDIQALKKAGKGYFYQVYALGNHTDVINVGATTVGKKNDVDTSWIQFAIKCRRDGSSSTYSEDKTNRGTACSYPGTNANDLYTVDKFLKYLYDNANSTSIWTGGYDYNKGSYYVDATCFISENYYKNLTWNQYVNDVDKRAFYVANEVKTSNDGRSVYAQTQYGLTQYNIQTFYDRSKAGSITAYGCETINDEEGKGFSVNGGGSTYQSAGSDTWNGRANMVADINTRTDTWKSLKNNTSLIKACMSRNRDLNGDGKISDDEIRWYAPTISQYIGIWIGEEIMSGESKLFNKATSTLSTSNDPGCRMLYYSSTYNENTYFSEEGLATNHNNSAYPPKLVRCLRNLKSNDVGYNRTPAKYYTYESSVVTLNNVDEKALNTSGEQGELNAHTERSALNKPAKKFKISNEKYYGEGYTDGWGYWHWTGVTPTQEHVVDGTFKCYNKYEEGDKKWRVPNQRELSVMFLVDKDKITNTYCRTIFSNTNFRKSWTYSSNIFTMDVNKWNATGSVRCIKVQK